MQDENLNPAAPQEAVPAVSETEAEIERRLYSVIEEKRNNVDELATFTKDLLKMKREAYAENKRLREEKEALQREKDAQETMRQQAEMAESEKLRLQLQEAQQRLEAVQREAERKSAEKAQMELNHAIDKHKATDPKYIEYLLREELNIIGKDPDLLSNFSVDKWMADKKAQMPHIFQQPAPAAPPAPPVPASTGLPPTPIVGTTYQHQTGKVTNPEDVKNLTNDWLQFKASLPTR